MLLPLRQCFFNNRHLPYSILVQYSRTIHTNHSAQNSILQNVLAKLTRRPPPLSNRLQYVPVALYLVPKRHFGQGKKIQIFGHAPLKTSSKFPDFLPLLAGALLITVGAYCVDLGKIKAIFGIDPFPRLRTTMQDVGYSYSEQIGELKMKRKDYVDPGMKFATAENKAEIHKYMMEQALQKYTAEVRKIAENDPEIKALLDGVDESQIKIENKEAFELKKQWIKEYMEALNYDDNAGAQVKESVIDKLGIDSNWQAWKVSAETDDFSDGDFDTGQLELEALK